MWDKLWDHLWGEYFFLLGFVVVTLISCTVAGIWTGLGFGIYFGVYTLTGHEVASVATAVSTGGFGFTCSIIVALITVENAIEPRYGS